MDVSRLQDDLKGQFRGVLHLDSLSRGLYATDASLFEMEPLAVAIPLNEADLQILVRYAYEHSLPLIPRGAGTGVAGEAIGTGIIVDLSVHFRSILEIGTDTVRVQPGVIYQHLNRELAKHGRRFAPDPASGSVCTIGGMLATNASGSRAILHGYTSDHVQHLKTIWDTGEAGQTDWSEEAAFDSRTQVLQQGLRDILTDQKEILAQRKVRTRYDRCGYALHRVLHKGQVDLSKLLVGSEGTLAFFTEATLKTIPLPVNRSAVLFVFFSLEQALRAAVLVGQTQPSACELLDRRLVSLARSQSDFAAQNISPTAEAILIVEWERDYPKDAEDAAQTLIDRLQQKDRLAGYSLSAETEDEIDQFWKIRELALPSLYSLGRGRRPLAFIEDIGVPVEDLPELVAKFQTILKQQDTTASLLIHAATGQIHIRPFLDPSIPTDAAKLWAIAGQMYDLVIDNGGTISTQHGTGLARTPWVEKQFGKLFPLLREVKRLFDPRNILNPGKIVELDPSRPAWPLRTSLPLSTVEPDLTTPAHPRLLIWKEGELEQEISNCNGCGECRTEVPPKRMCPIFRVQLHEAASPRAKPNLLRRLLTSPTNGEAIHSDEVRDVAELCIHCKMCVSECPAHVNVPKMMLEAKAANQSQHGLSRSNWVLARMEAFAAMASKLALTTNTLLSRQGFRWLLEKLVGVSRHRRLASFARQNFLKTAFRRGWCRKRKPTENRPRVAYFADTFAMYNDPSIGVATVSVLQHQGVDVYVPPTQRGCGMAPLIQGDVDTAREVITHNLRLLAELIREGYTILCSEPTAAVLLRQEMAHVLDDPDVPLVANHTLEATSYLSELHNKGQFRKDLQPLPISVGHHVPCHIKALGLGVHGPKLLAFIPEMQVHTIDVSCSGMAGTFGLKAANFQTSMQAGQPMLDELNRPRVLFGSTECSACRMQMEQGSHKRTLHPLQYLALSYGLVPEIADQLNRRLLRGLLST